MQDSYFFGEFQLDCSRYQLRRNERTLKLERLPMELLILLAEKNGAIVSRQEIIDRLWGKNVFIDTEHGIKTAIRKIRTALHEDADHPRFLITVQGKGYRLAVEKNGGSPQQLSSREEKPATYTVLPSAARHSRAASLKLAITAALLLTAAAALTYTFRSHIFSAGGSHIQSIAVLPLVNLSGDKSQDYFADGMTDEFITALAKNRNLRVVSRTSAMQYKGVNRPLRDMARELGVDDILEGSIERSQNRVHITVQLIYVPTDSHLWAESYDRDLNEAFSLPEELSATVAKEVKVATSPPPLRRYIDPEAHDAYLHGLHFRFGNTVRGGLPYFEKAIQLQPDYAAAWSGLSDTYGVLAIGGEGPSSEVSKKWESAARKAVELDDSLPEAHNSMALWYLFYARDWQHAETESLRSLALDPASPRLPRAQLHSDGHQPHTGGHRRAKARHVDRAFRAALGARLRLLSRTPIRRRRQRTSPLHCRPVVRPELSRLFVRCLPFSWTR